MFEIMEEPSQEAVIKVIGVGGCGGQRLRQNPKRTAEACLIRHEPGFGRCLVSSEPPDEVHNRKDEDVVRANWHGEAQVPSSWPRRAGRPRPRARNVPEYP